MIESMIDPDYPPSPLDPPFSLRNRRGCGAFRTSDALVIHGNDDGRSWIRSDATVALEECR